MMEQFAYITQKINDPFNYKTKRRSSNILATEFQYRVMLSLVTILIIWNKQTS